MKAFLTRHGKKMAVAAVVLPLVAYVGLGLIIGQGVKKAVAFAQAEEQGRPVESLIQVASSENYGLKERNRAIWALGQLGDPKALPALEGLLTHRACDHGTSVCQKEVRKAVEGCRGGTNLSAPVWRHGDLVGG